MRQKTYKHILFLGIILSLSSCEDFFETTLEIDPPEHVEQLVVQAFGSTETDVLNVSVSKTTGILDDVYEDDLQINDAAVVLIHNGTSYALDFTTPSQNQGKPYNYILADGNIDLKAGELYTLEVETSGFEKAIATCSVPNIVLPDNFEFDEEGPNVFESEYSEVSMILSDPIAEDNFYEFNLSIGNEFNNEIYFQSVYTETLDPVVEEAISGLLLKDISFNGEDKVLELLLERFYIQNEPDVADRIYVSWRTVSEDHYLYTKSFEQHLESADNPFASPVQVYSNVENGLGIFTIYNEDRIKIN